MEVIDMKTSLGGAFKFRKEMKSLIGHTLSKAERLAWKNAFIDAESTIQEKSFKGAFVMNYDVSVGGKSNRKEVNRVEDNTPLKIV